jgi:hypothetical protein
MGAAIMKWDWGVTTGAAEAKQSPSVIIANEEGLSKAAEHF